jgi:hypothetical protein
MRSRPLRGQPDERAPAYSFYLIAPRVRPATKSWPKTDMRVGTTNHFDIDQKEGREPYVRINAQTVS